MIVLNIFSTPLYITNINIGKEEHDYVIANRNNSKQNLFGNFVSNSSYVLNNSIFDNINTQIMHHIKEYSESVFGYSSKLKITTSWVTYNPKNTSQHTHNHRNSILGGVMYFSENPSPICFFKNEFNQIVPDKLKHTEYNSNSYAVNCNYGMLILFPSELTHGVEINNNEHDRISLAFNTFYTGSIGSELMANKLEFN